MIKARAAKSRAEDFRLPAEAKVIAVSADDEQWSLFHALADQALRLFDDVPIPPVAFRCSCESRRRNKSEV
jgi:hypothetical protein